MTRYFFHVHDGIGIVDDVGTEFAGPDEARAEAVVASGAMIRDHGRRFWRHPEWNMQVVDEHGAEVCSLTFSAAALPLAA